MRFSKFLRTAVIFFIIWSWIFYGQPRVWFGGRDAVIKFPPALERAEALNVSSSDGLILYSQSGSTTQWRTYTSSSNAFSAATNIDISAGAVSTKRIAVKTSPVRQEAIAVFASSSVIQAMCYDGTNWSNEWSTSTNNAQAKPFDVAYEASSGDVMVLYSTNVATISELAYRTKSGTTGCGSANWSAETLLDPVRTSGLVNWVSLATDRRTTSTLIAAIWADKNHDLSSMIWSGTAWGNEPSTALAINIEHAASAPLNNLNMAFDVEYESGSGDVMVVYSEITGGAARDALAMYATCTGGTSTCTWSSTSTVSTTNDATNLDISVNPTSDEIVFAGMGNASGTLDAAYWDGSAWTASSNLDASTTQIFSNGRQVVATGWLVQGGASRSIIVYNDIDMTIINWAVGNGSSFSVQTDFTPTTAFTAPVTWFDFQSDPNNQDRLMLTLSDAGSDFWAKRLQMTSGPTFTWTEPDAGTALETTLGASVPRNFHFAYWWYIPYAPIVTNVVLNSGSAISLTENATTTVNVVASTTDQNGYAELISATSSIYRSGVTSTSACTADNNNCYQLASTSCSFSTCSGNNCNLTCTAYIYYFAEPTDSGAYSAQNWLANVTVVDKYNATGTAGTASGVELNTLLALDVTSAINYGTLQPGNDTGATNQTTIVTNTGNAAIDVEISGSKLNLDGLDGSSYNIGVTQQLYATSTFTYSTCTICTTLSATAVTYEIDLVKPTTTTAITDDIFWGLNVPSGRPIGTYSGTNTFSPVAD